MKDSKTKVEESTRLKNEVDESVYESLFIKVCVVFKQHISLRSNCGKKCVCFTICFGVGLSVLCCKMTTNL